MTIEASGVSKIAIRVPAWCEKFTLSHDYTMERGYAVVENDGRSVVVDFDLTPRLVWANARVLRAAHQVAVMKGPVVYCAEGVDHEEGQLHTYLIPRDFVVEEELGEGGLPVLRVSCVKQLTDDDSLYRNEPPKTQQATLRLIPYHNFANREETDMRVWFYTL